MIRPSSLHRGDDDPIIEAPASNINRDSLDCGITAMRCCNSHACQKLGTTRNFVITLVLIGLIQSAVERYFRLSVRQAAAQFDYDPLVVEWLLVAGGLAQGVVAIPVAYWANRIHRISWLGTLLMLQALACLAVIIPIVTNNNDQNQSITAPAISNLCTERTIEQLADEPTYADTTLAMMFVLQLFVGCGRVAFYALGLSYVDDNVRDQHSPALIGAVLAGSLWGPQFGTALGFLVAATPLGWWLGWSVLAPLLFVVALIVALFPRRLIKSMVRQATDDIVHEASSSQMSLDGLGERQQQQHHQTTTPPPLLADISFKRSIHRVLKNRVLMCNVLAATFVATATVNYAAHETEYLRARFLVPTHDDDTLILSWPSRLWTVLLRPLTVAVAVLLAGLIIAKARPTARRLAGWSALTGCVAIALFVGYVFIDCGRSPVAGGYSDRLTRPYCSRSCLCDEDIAFQPVCPANSFLTYFSPCHAGCSDVAEVNALRLYTNCTCGTAVDAVLLDADGVATEGACGADECQPLWIVYQALTVLGAAAVASAWMGRVLVSLRCVLRQDRALALALELMLVGLVAYGPGHAGYQAIANITCEYWSHQPGAAAADAASVCQLHAGRSFANALNIVSAVLMLIAVFFDVLVWAFAGDVELFGDEEAEREYRMVPMRMLATATDRANQDESSQPFIPVTHPTTHTNGVTTIDNANVIRFQFNGTPASTSGPAGTTSISERMRLSQQQQQMQYQPSTSGSTPTASSSSVTYARVHRSSPDHADELDFRMQQMRTANGNGNVRPSELLMRRTALAGGDINPSRGNRGVTDGVHEMDIVQIERAMSSIASGSPALSESGGRVGAGDVVRSRSRTETDF